MAFAADSASSALGDWTDKAITPPKNTNEVAPTVNNKGFNRGRLIRLYSVYIIREYN
jgi:hypothetical protein